MESAYKEQRDVLQSLGVDVKLNSNETCDIIHIHSPGISSCYLAKKSKIPVITTAHTMPRELGYMYKFGYMAEEIGRYYFANFHNNADIVIAPTGFTKSRLEQMKVTKPIEVISNGINLKKFQFSQEKRDEFRKKYKIKPHEKVIYSAGLMSSRKGFDKFMSIAKEMEDYKFVWIGKKSVLFLHRNSFSDRILVKNAPSNFISAGFVDDVVAAHCAGDIFLFSSPFETQGLVALEAAACSRPLVVEDVPSFEWLGKSCFRAKTIEEYRNQIEDAMSRYDKCQNYSVELAKKNSIIRTGKSLVELYERVLSNGI